MLVTVTVDITDTTNMIISGDMEMKHCWHCSSLLTLLATHTLNILLVLTIRTERREPYNVIDISTVSVCIIVEHMSACNQEEVWCSVVVWYLNSWNTWLPLTPCPRAELGWDWLSTGKVSTIYYLHFLQNSAESPACRLPTAHPSPILSPISLNISLLYILIFSAVATKRKLNELKPIKYKGPQLCLWDEGVCGLLQLPHEKIVIVTTPDAAVCRAAAVLQSPRGCSAAPR